jgi:hypothetical protein
MADDFAAIARDAMASVPADLKARVTFTREIVVNDPATGTSSVSTVATISGTAVGVPGDPDEYEALGLVLSKARTLVFVPDTAGEYPDERYAIVWAGESYDVKSSRPTAPNGTALAARVVLSR